MSMGQIKRGGQGRPYKKPLISRLSSPGGIWFRTVRAGRFVVIMGFISGLKRGRLPSRGIYDYRRWKPIYFAWGEKNKAQCLLREFSVKFFRAEIFPIRIEVFATPKDVWAHWQELKARKS